MTENKDHLSKVFDICLQSVEEVTKVPQNLIIQRSRFKEKVMARTMCFYAVITLIYRYEKISVKYGTISLVRTYIMDKLGLHRTSQYDLVDRHISYMLNDEYKSVFQKVLDRAEELYKSISNK